MTVELIQGMLLAFAIVVILMPGYIRLMRWAGFAKQIRVDGPESHQVKSGTPTAGGALLIGVVASLALLFNLVDASTFAPLAALGLVGVLGFADDWLNASTGDGIRARQKLLWQTAVAVFAAWQIQRTYQIAAVAVPFVGAVAVAPWIYIAFAAFAIVAMSNGVNLTDGLDGLAGGTLIFAFVSFLIIALLNEPGPAEPRDPVLAAHRGAAGLPVVQRSPGPGVHGRRRLAEPGGDARGRLADHRPDPDPAPDRGHLRRGGRFGGAPGRLLQDHRRPAHLPDEPRSITTSSWAAGPRRRSRSASGSSAPSPASWA